jgi:predicted Rossmann fold flavoprotein
VGGGAAGLATAIFAAQREPGWKITILDSAKRLGAKILISGGGRCNVTNDVVTAEDFWGGSRNIIRRVLGAFSVPETVEFFRRIGISLHVEPGGKLFPDTNRARTVLDALINEANRLGVHLATGQRVTAIDRRDEHFCLATASEVLCARRVVVATGGMSVPKTGSDGFGYRLV